MDRQKEKQAFLVREEIKELIKDLEPGTMLTLEMPGVPDGSGPGRKKEGEGADGRSV